MKKNGVERRQYSDELKREAVQMLLDGYSASSIAANLGIRNVNQIHRWKKKILAENPTASSLDSEVRELRDRLARVERERDILKKALSIFSQRM